MALIKCNECGKEVSSNAVSCPNCGNPISKDNSVKIAFPKNQNQIFNTGCTVSSEDGEILAKCKQGEIAEFEISVAQDVIVKMSGMLNSKNVTVEPGGRYKVNIRAFGTIAVSKVDIL